VDIYTIIFAALAVFILLRLRSVLGQRTRSERPRMTDTFFIRLSMIAIVLCALLYVAYEAKWYSALKAAVTLVTTISGLAPRVRRRHRRRGHIIGNGTPLGGCAGLVFSALEGLEGPKTLAFCASNVCHGNRLVGFGQGLYLKKAKPLDGLLRDHTSERKADDPPLPHQPSGSNRWQNPKGPRSRSLNFLSWPAEKSTATMRREFYLSPQWLNSRARYQAIKAARGACQACGARKSDGAKLVVDHIKPVRHHWHLRFAADNLQVLCEPCNLGKGSWDQTDWR
jgi:5-methylcytosine-specific restriction endonuclease McrA